MVTAEVEGRPPLPLQSAVTLTHHRPSRVVATQARTRWLWPRFGQPSETVVGRPMSRARPNHSASSLSDRCGLVFLPWPLVDLTNTPTPTCAPTKRSVYHCECKSSQRIMSRCAGLGHPSTLAAVSLSGCCCAHSRACPHTRRAVMRYGVGGMRTRGVRRPHIMTEGLPMV